MSAPSMRERFVEVAAAELQRDERVAVVLADIGVDRFEGSLAGSDRDRIVNVGIREQALIGVTAGLALEGMRPVAHSYASFLVERPFEQIKLDLGHQDVGAVLVSIGASYDDADAGRTHHAPGDVALMGTLPGWTIHVPGHPDEAAALVAEAIRADGRVYIRLSDESNAEALPTTGLQVVRRGGEGSPLILAVGPALAAVLEATADLDATIAYTARVRPFPAAELRTLVRGPEVVLVEPTLAGTSAGELARALSDLPTRQLSVGVGNTELRRYGTHEEHRAAHGLDAAGVAAALAAFLEQPVGAVS